MANTQDALQRMLEINNKVENNMSRVNQIQRQKPTSQDLDSIVESYDKMVYGDSPVLINEEQKPYNANEEFERLKEVSEHGRRPIDLENKKIPKYIVEDILRNPLEIKPIMEDKNMDMLEEKLQGKMPGIKASTEILKKIENNDKKRIIENKQIQTPSYQSSSIVDYGLIKTIIENVIDEKLSNKLNECKTLSQNAPSMKIMSFKDNFYFVDNNDNVYECVMKYKGKRKRKR